MSEAVYPNDWQERRLTGLANYHNGLAFKPADWSEDGVRIIRIEQLNNPEGDYDHFNGFFPDANAINDGDLIFSWSATLKVSIWKYGKAVLNQHLFKVVPKSGFDKSYLYFLLDFHMDALSAGSHGSTMKHIKRGELEKYSVRLPFQREQEKIVEVLATIDAAIEKTEALIAKYQQIKAGLMHDLFTRGVTADGKLRPPREQAPELYQETPIGWIPKEWDVVRIDNPEIAIIDGDRGVHYPQAHELLESGYCLFLSATNVTKDGFKFVMTQFISREKDELLGTGKLARGDIVITTRGTVGNIAYFDNNVPFPNVRINSGMVIIRSTHRKLNTEFLYCSLRNYVFLREYQRVVSGSAQPQLPIKDMKRFHSLMPPLPEQQLIVGRVALIDSRLGREDEYLVKLCQQKSGLMSDLLTGRVRVSLNEAEGATL